MPLNTRITPVTRKASTVASVESHKPYIPNIFDSISIWTWQLTIIVLEADKLLYLHSNCHISASINTTISASPLYKFFLHPCKPNLRKTLEEKQIYWQLFTLTISIRRSRYQRYKYTGGDPVHQQRWFPQHKHPVQTPSTTTMRTHLTPLSLPSTRVAATASHAADAVEMSLMRTTVPDAAISCVRSVLDPWSTGRIKRKMGKPGSVGDGKCLVVAETAVL